MFQLEQADKAVYGGWVEPRVLIGSGLVYVFLALGLYERMKKAKAMDLKHTMRVYNLVQVAVCAYMTIGGRVEFGS